MLLQIVCVDSLYHNACRCTSAVTYRRTTVLALLQLVEKRDHYPCARAADGMTESDGAASWVDVIRSKTEDLQLSASAVDQHT